MCGLEKTTLHALGQKSNKKPALRRVLYIALDWLKHLNGGAGGNRTRVRKSSTDSSTYLALLFNLTCNTPTDKQFARELPKG